MYHPGRSVRLRSSARTSTGRVRENNEDKIFLLERESLVLAMVADGMGGAAAGEEASRIAIDTIHEGLLRHDLSSGGRLDTMAADILSDTLRHVIRTANFNIVQHAQYVPEMKGMGTTVTLALVRGTYAVIGHVGDSRAYLVDGDDGSISQITSDHSFVEAMVAAGHITRDEAEDHPMRNVLYRALGQTEDVDVDVYHSYLRTGDRLVLCSDGLTLHVKPHEIAHIASEFQPEVASQKLIELTNERGGRDNVSVVVISIEEDDSAQATIEVHALSDEDDTLILLRPRQLSGIPPAEAVEPQNADVENSYKPVSRLLTGGQRPTAPDLIGGHRSYREGGLTDTLVEGRDLHRRDH